MTTETKLLLLASLACALALGACMFDLPQAKDGAGAPDASSPQPDATADTNTPGVDTGPNPILDSGAGDAPGVPCPEAGTIRVGQGATSFCIDATEVTDEAFLDFVLAGGPQKNGAGTPPQCQFNLINQPTPPGRDTLPMVNVNWCDAYAYCTWAGKHLCGTGNDEWFAACSHRDDGQHAYPYGNVVVPTACNALSAGVGAIQPVMSNPKCVGGYPGIFDMTGNVAEWEDACDDDAGIIPPGQDSNCNVRGGAWDEDPRVCRYVAQLTRQTRVANVGFRCCY